MQRIFDGLYVDQLIQKNERGEFVVYPHGMIGLLPAEQEAGVRQKLRLLMLVSLVIGISYGLFLLRIVDAGNAVSHVGWVIIGGSAAPLLGAIVYFQSRLTTGLQPISGRLSAGEWLRRGRQARATWTYWASLLLGALTLLLSVPGIALGFTDSDLLAAVGGVFLLLVGALLTWDGVLGLLERRRATKAR